jgi:hypothetical protein
MVRGEAANPDHPPWKSATKEPPSGRRAMERVRAFGQRVAVSLGGHCTHSAPPAGVGQDCMGVAVRELKRRPMLSWMMTSLAIYIGVGVLVYFWTMGSYRQPSGFFLSI